jgi:hypothetical protein
VTPKIAVEDNLLETTDASTTGIIIYGNNDQEVRQLP